MSIGEMVFYVIQYSVLGLMTLAGLWGVWATFFDDGGGPSGFGGDGSSGTSL